MTFQPRLQSRIREAFATTHLTDTEVARRLGCSSNWVKMFKAGAIKSPNVDRMEHLLYILTGELVEPIKMAAATVQVFRADGSTYEIEGRPVDWTPVEMGIGGTITGRFSSQDHGGVHLTDEQIEAQAGE